MAELKIDLGYEQRLYRGIDAFMSFSFGFIEVGGLACITSLLGYGLMTGGPGAIVWGWIISFFATMMISLSMAEICSVYPFAGSVYNWSGNLATIEWGPFAAYWTGLSNWLGNAAGDASIAYFFATTLNAALVATNLTSLSNDAVTGVAAGALLLWTLLNFFRVDQIGWLINFGSVLNLLFTIVLIIVLFVQTPSLNSPQYVFFTYYNDTGFTSQSYVLAISLLFSLFSFSGYDASAHLAEETTEGESTDSQNPSSSSSSSSSDHLLSPSHNHEDGDAEGDSESDTSHSKPSLPSAMASATTTTAPMAIIWTCLATGLSGLLIILSLLFAMPSIEDAINAENAAVEITVQAIGSVGGAVLAWVLVMIIFQCGVSSVTVTARITYAMCRDNLFPYSDILSEINPQFKSPINICLFLFVIDVILIAIALVSTTGFYSITGITVIGFQVSYGLPIFIRVIHPCPETTQLLRECPLSLGDWSWFIGLFSSLWLFGTSVLFFLPTLSPVTSSNMNYSVVIVGGVVIVGVINWEVFLKDTYKGPQRLADRLNIIIHHKHEKKTQFNNHNNHSSSSSSSPHERTPLIPK